MNITVVGTGYVGLVTGVGLAHIGHTVTCLDIDRDKIEQLQQGIVPIYEPGLADMMKEAVQEERLSFTTSPKQAYGKANIIFLAVGTPPNPDGSANLTYIARACEEIGEHITEAVIVVTKSTVPVGTNDYIKKTILQHLQADVIVDVASNPEFLREGAGIHDFFHGDRIVIGADCEETAAIIEEIYKPLNISIFKTDVRSTELIKYASNAFLAAKISFINEISNICEKVGANIEDVAFGMGLDKRIGNQFLHAGIGYGGSCFPKDTNALVQIAGNVHYDFQLLKAVIEVNNKQQASLVKKAERVINLRGKKVALLGLAFKPNTDDMREAPSLVIAKQLLDAGAHIIAYDPQAIHNARAVLPESIVYTEDLDEALTGADAAFLVTEWDSIKQYPLAKYVQLMKNPLLFDGRNCYSLDAVERYEMDYYSIGRAAVLRKKISV
ncbi:UDP-glucose dehydrogenase family protein [Ectobacillus panaciterrae]|uniref:UDP-glucose dehydrogenase family protein n=1 Tax=Ectobacillus panaciterrae TaxID=363872 RepID=UPI00040F48A5|nr:UDP-glucose/GDP-mannose dehydrogenase family protein [Ectobacillus panaciterrae]